MKNKKQLTFDIDTNVAKEILGEKNYTTAYANIKNFMTNEGWLHIEGSVYMSSKALSTTKVAHLINRLKKQYPYLTKCIRDMHQSDISNVHSLEHHFEYDGTPGEFAENEKVKN
jgi:virulence-associated protein VapD